MAAYVVTEKGAIQIKDLIADPAVLWLGGTDPGRNAKESQDISDEMQSRTAQKHTKVAVTAEALKPGAVRLTVTVTVKRVK